jgi:hypothetical protein
LKRITTYLKYFVILLFPMLSGCLTNYWYIPAGTLAPRPVYVYSTKKVIPTVSAGYRSSAGYNKGETSQLAMASIRLGGRLFIFQGFVGLNGYSGFYKVGALDSIYTNKSAFGIAPEGELNIVIPMKDLDLGPGIYLRSTKEFGEYRNFMAHLLDDNNPYPGLNIESTDFYFFDLHFIVNVHRKLDYSFMFGGFITPIDNDDVQWRYSDAFLGAGVSSKTLGGWLTLTPSQKPLHGPILFEMGISYRLLK